MAFMKKVVVVVVDCNQRRWVALVQEYFNGSDVLIHESFCITCCSSDLDAILIIATSYLDHVP